MKSSVGVTICAVLVLIGSALALVGTAGAAFMLLGPLRGQLLDPANLPPGADLSMLRGAMMSGLLMGGGFGAFGVATGIGLIRLWKWARYAAIVLGFIVIAFSVFPAIFMAFGPIPLPSSSPDGAVPVGFRMWLVVFYLVWAVLAGLFVYMMMRKSTAAQFNGDAVVSPPRKRPISVTIIAWLMIASGVMSVPMLAWANMPALFLGIVLTGIAAKIFFITYMAAYVVVGVGLIRKTKSSIVPAVALHSLAFVNALSLLVPGVWLRYGAAMRSISPVFVEQPGGMAGRYFGVLFGVAFAAVTVFFLLRAKRTLHSTAH